MALASALTRGVKTLAISPYYRRGDEPLLIATAAAGTCPLAGGRWRPVWPAVERRARTTLAGAARIAPALI